jgi:hypothetical protein
VGLPTVLRYRGLNLGKVTDELISEIKPFTLMEGEQQAFKMVRRMAAGF